MSVSVATISRPMSRSATHSAVDALARLRRAYRRYFDNPTELKKHACTRAHKEAVDLLTSREVAERVDPLITAAIESGHATPSQAMPTLDEAPADVVRYERRIGRKNLGYPDGFLAKHLKRAKKALRKAADKKRPLALPSTCAEIAAELEDVAARVHDAVDSSVEEPARIKRAHRRDAHDYAMRRVYMVGSIVVDACQEHEHVFTYSYSLSLGIAAIGNTPRKARVVAVEDRASEAA